MSTLTLTFSFKPKDVVYTMQSRISSAQSNPEPELHFRCTKRNILHDGHSKVLRGTLSGGEAYIGLTDVVCKWVVLDAGVERLRQEAELYATKLAPLQGVYIPKFLGFFSASVPGIGGEMLPAACMLLEYCGKPIQGWLSHQPMELRMKAYHALEAVHDTGLCHGDLEDSDRHFLVQDGHVRLIDFDRAYEHDCSHEKVYPYDFEPSSGNFDCGELEFLALNSDIWTPVSLHFFGYVVCLRETPTIESLLESAHKVRPGFSDTYVRRLAVEAFEGFCKTWGDRFHIIFADMTENTDPSHASTDALQWPMNPDESCVELRHKLLWLLDWNKKHQGPKRK